MLKGEAGKENERTESEVLLVIPTPNRAVQVRVGWVLYSTGGFYASLTEYQAGKARRNGPSPSDFAPTHRGVLITAEEIRNVIQTLEQIEAVAIERGCVKIPRAA